MLLGKQGGIRDCNPGVCQPNQLIKAADASFRSADFDEEET